jgi:formyl-CoA transferase
MTDRSNGHGPLEGITVLDASTMLACPYTAGLLADFGADVIKLEDCGPGDPMRLVGPKIDGQSIISKITNRNKRSVAVDLRHDAGRQVFRELAAAVDVVVTNFRASTLDRWDLTYETLSAANPRLVMYHLSAYGSTGSRCDEPGFARVAEAYTGLTYATGDPDGPPMFSGYALADGIGGVHGAYAVMLALFERERTGKGQLVQLSLAGATLRLLEGHVASYGGVGVVPTRTGNDNGMVPNGIYRTKDEKWIVLPVSSPNMWTRLCGALDRQDWLHDPRFVDNASRAQHRAELEAQLVPELGSRTYDELTSILRSAEVAVGPVNSMEDIFADEDIWNEGALINVRDHRLDRDLPMPGVFPQLSRTPGAVTHVGPEPGDHTTEVLTTILGYDQARIDRLAATGVVSVNSG